MHTVSLIILVLNQSGCWLAGTDGKVSVRWAVPDQSKQATLVWELSIDSILLDRGSAVMNPADRPTEITIKCPNVRARTNLVLRYHLVSADLKQELASGTLPIHAFPNTLTDGWANLLQGKNVAIVDSADGLPALLTKAKVNSLERVDQVLDLQLRQPGIILVGANQLEDLPFAQSVLVDQARSGAGVLVLCQSNISRLIGNAVVHRARPATSGWQHDNPLLAGFDPEDLENWFHESPAYLSAIRLSPGSGADPIVGWADEQKIKAGDALVSVQRIGRGRIVLFQLPLGSWRTDPRTVLFIGNALDYLSSPVESLPTVSRPERQQFLWSPARPVHVVLTPAGDYR